MSRSIGNGDTDSGARSIGDQPTMQGGFREIRIGMKTGPDGRYLIKDILGKGGMGEVYLALDEISKTEVAIKLVPREVSTNEDEMEQVRRNFALVRNLHHPNIAAVTALERLPCGEFILVMEAVLGRKTLHKDRLSRDNERLPVPEAIKVCKQVAEALDYAHSQKVIHRDVKPSNVLLTADGHVKLTDFGLAAQIMSSMNRVSLLPTHTSGTRPYMAPEQWEGRIQDAKTDQWSLAVLFYELVAGRLPFPADDLGVLERQILEKTPSKPESLSDNQWTSLRRALSKEKDDRFETCAAFAGALARDTRQRLPKQGRNGKPGVFVAVLAVLLVVAAFAIFRQFHVSEEAKREDVPPVPAAPSVRPAVEDTTRQQLNAERVAREQAETQLREQQKVAQQAKEEAQRLQREKEEADKARVAAEEAARQQKAESDRLAAAAEAKRIREAQAPSSQREQGPWRTLYSTDFTTDPGWTSDDRQRIRWDPDSGTLHGLQFNTQGTYAYTELKDFDPNRSWRWECDFQINEDQWSAGLTFGLFDASLKYPNGAGMDLSIADGGNYVGLWSTPETPPGIRSAWKTGNWYHGVMEFDADRKELTLTVTDKQSGGQLARKAIPARVFPSTMNRFGVSRLHMKNTGAGASGGAKVDYNIDNLRVQTKIR